MDGGGGIKHKYGSLLKSHPEIKIQADKYPSTNPSLWWDDEFNKKNKNIPDSFDGRDAWGDYIQFSSNQQSSESWASVATNILADRYSIITAGQINLFLSYNEIIACINPPQHQSQDNEKYIDATQGYSIYDAWEYIYKYGVPETNCFSNSKLKYALKEVYPDDTKKQMLPADLTYVEKQDIYGVKCTKIEDNQLFCLTKQDKKPIARRTFFSDGIFNIKGNTLEETIVNIKYELLRFGPVAAGFVVYENFASGYNGIDIYTGPKSTDKALGGHYVSIIGWGNKHHNKTVPEYWICRNNWGTDWGLLGFFKIQIGIKECQLEDNVSSCVPFYHIDHYDGNDGVFNGKIVNITDMEIYNPTLVKKRNMFAIDKSTFYPIKALDMIKKGELYGDLDPLIAFPKDLPDLKYYWAKDFLKFNVITNEQDSPEYKKSGTIFWYIMLGVLFMTCFYFGYSLKNGKKSKK